MSTRITLIVLAVILTLGAVLIPMSFAQGCDPSVDYLQMGENAFNGGDYNGALTAYNCAVDLQPAPRTYNRRGWTHYQLGNYRAAYDDFTRAMELDPNYAYAYNNRGLVLYYWGEYAAAVADFDQALALNIPIEGVEENRAKAATRLGESSSVIVATPTLQPTTETLNLGDIEKTPTPAATVIITPTPAFTPTQPTTTFQEAEEAYRLGEYEDATTAFSLLEQDGATLCHRGYMYMVMGSYDYAAQFMTAALEAGQPLCAPRAYVYLQLGEEALALADYETVLASESLTWIDYPYLMLVYRDVENKPDQGVSLEDWLANFTIQDEGEIILGEPIRLTMQDHWAFTFTFEGQADQPLTILGADASTDIVDVLIAVFDENGVIVDFNDDSDLGFDALLENLTLPADGTYTLIVTHAGGGAEGPVEVVINPADE